MASSDYDQKVLGKIAKATTATNPIVAGGLLRLLGLSVTLSKKVYKARRLRRLDTSRDTKSLQLYHQIIWTSREGLAILNGDIFPYISMEEHGPEIRVLSLKLRASFYHIICLFYNQPPASQIQVPNHRAPLAIPEMPMVPERDLPPEHAAGHHRTAGLSPARRGQTLREPVTSIVCEGSVLTNPYPMDAPPGLAPISTVTHPMSYLIPYRNYLPLTDSYFSAAHAYAASNLPGSHPLRLSVALEYVAFLWDCQHDHERSRSVAGKAIKETYTAEEGMEDDEFMDASDLVKGLHRMMKRKSWEGTPKTGQSTGIGSPLQFANEGSIPPMPTVAPAIPISISSNMSAQRMASDIPPQGGPVLGSPFVAGDQRPSANRSRSRSGGSKTGNTSAEGVSTPRAPAPTKHIHNSGGSSGRRKSASSSEATPRIGQGGKRDSVDTGGSSTPRAIHSQQKKSPMSPKRHDGTPTGRSRRPSKA